MRTSARLWVLLTIVTVVTTALYVRWQQPHLDLMLETDEADYVRASSYGAWANYIGAHERSGGVFARDVLDEYRQTGSSHAYAREWEADDASALRHYHPPFAFYPVAMLAGSGNRDERTMRTVPLITGVLATVAAGLLAWVLLAGASLAPRLLFTALAGVVTAVSPYHALASTTITPHAAFSLLSTLTLVALTRAVQTSALRWWLTACALLGLTLLTVPYWTLLILATLWVWWWGIRHGRRSVRLLAMGSLTALLALTVAWPPAVLGLGMVKPVLLYLNIAMNPPDVGRTTGDWIPAFVRTHVLVTTMMVAGIAGLMVATRDERRAAVPALLFTFGFFLLNLRVSYMKPLYVADVVPAAAGLACALSGWVAMRLSPRLQPLPAIAALLFVAVPLVRVPVASPPSNQWRRALSALDGRFAGQRMLVTPRQAGAMVKYYLTRTHVVLDSDDPADVRKIRQQLAAGEFDVVLGWGGVVDRNGAAIDVMRTGRPSGQAMVDSSTISWWITADLGQ